MRFIPMVLVAGLGWGSLSAQDAQEAAGGADAEAAALTEQQVQAKIQPVFERVRAKLAEGAGLEAIRPELQEIAAIRGQAEGQIADMLAVVPAQIMNQIGAEAEAEATLREALEEIEDPNAQAMAFVTLGEVVIAADDAEAKLNALIEQAQAAEVDPQLIAHLESMKGQIRLQVGKPFPQIAFTAIDGTEVDTKAMEGKPFFVDFWATWCGPCVQEMPNVIAAYEAWHDQGFEVIGISLDQNESALLSFIDEHDMPWPQYFDGKGWDNDIAGEFGIRSIPATFLVDAEGMIVATDLRGDALDTHLQDLLGDNAEQ